MQKYYVRVFPDGNTYWYSDPECKIYHRIDGPSVETPDGFKAYYQNGQLHRIDGPAVEYADGYKAYWVNGKRHRLDGPARIWSNGKEEYWIDGVIYQRRISCQNSTSQGTRLVLLFTPKSMNELWKMFENAKKIVSKQ